MLPSFFLILVFLNLFSGIVKTFTFCSPLVGFISELCLCALVKCLLLQLLPRGIAVLG